MLDRRSLTLLDYLNKECLNSGYKIFLLEELCLAFSPTVGADKDVVLMCLKMLSDHEYLSIKYQDELEVCLCPTGKGRLVSENRIDQKIEKQLEAKKYFLYSFLGAFTGGLLVFILLLVIFIIRGGR